MSGYINLHRAIQTHWIYKEDRVFSKFEAWTDILMRVNHTEAKVMHNGTLETVQRGQTIWSLGDMEARWKWSNRKVKRFLDCLVADQMLAYKSTTKKTYLTVENYDFYQSPQGKKAPPMHQEDTTDAFQKHTNNNDKELNNDKEINNKDNTFSAYTSNPEFLLTLNSFEDFRKKIKNPLTDRAKKMLVEKLDKLATTDEEKITILNESIFNGWKGVFELKERKTDGLPKGPKPQVARKEPNYVMREFTAEELEALPRG